MCIRDSIYTPNANFFGSDSFVYEVSDGNGGTAQATVNITVGSVNDGPVAADDTFVTTEDASLTDSVLGNDSDTDGDTLTVNTTPVSDPANGTVVLNSDGTFTYTPDANFFGSDSFVYEVTDGNGGTAQATVNITVVAENDPPTNSTVTLTASLEDNDRIITETELLANAGDVDGDALSVTGLAISSGNGSLVDNGDGTWTYTPAADDDSDVVFSYEVTDSQDSVVGNATLDILPVNDAPTTSAVTLTASLEDTARIITESELLANANDVDGDA